MLEGLFYVYTEIVLKLLFLKSGYRWGKYGRKGHWLSAKYFVWTWKSNIWCLFHQGKLTSCLRNSTWKKAFPFSLWLLIQSNRTSG